MEERQANVSGKREEDRWEREGKREKDSHRRRENGEMGIPGVT